MSGLEPSTAIGASFTAEGSVYPILLYTTPDKIDGQPVDAEVADALLFGAASGHGLGKSYASDERVAAATRSIHRMSTSWDALVLRHGAAFALKRTNDDFVPLARVYFHTIYTDAFLLVRMQDFLVRWYEYRTRALIEPIENGAREFLSDFGKLEREYGLDELRYWLSGGSANTGASMRFINTYQDVTELAERARAVNSQMGRLAAYSERDRIAADQARRDRFELLLGIVTLILVPFTVADQIVNITGLRASWSTAPQVAAVYLVPLLFTALLIWAIARRRRPRRRRR